MKSADDLLDDCENRILRLKAVNRKLAAALSALLEVSEKDCGVPTEHDGDDEPVGSMKDEDGSIKGTAMTFGILRRARAALDLR